MPWTSALAGAADYLRHMLTAAGTLPPRDEELARAERWLPALVAIELPADRRLVQAYATWQVMRRLRASAAAARPRTPTAHARNSIRAAVSFLAWLRDRGISSPPAGKPTSTNGCTPGPQPAWPGISWPGPPRAATASR